MSYLDDAELEDLGVRFGRRVLVSRDARLFGCDRIVLGDNVRVDAFAIISAGSGGYVEMGSHIHLAAGVRVFGGGGIRIGDFAGVSAASTLYSQSDDFGGDWLFGPQISEEETNVRTEVMVLERYSLVGAHCLLLPGAGLGEGSALGSMSMTASQLPSWTISVGVPAKPLRPRAKGLVERSERFAAAWSDKG